ncbi:hypothetical protein [Clostridium felsineum]|uniref:Uncharacterized protein n=1 Tax=Clostridium felsineum TaxID=36839 RepID=A0A1S8LV94_9CLOT|nr:hypothetical protein [Clostridium felsineum]MCR3758723.1 hypothetical protein [Clostridium felsineum]URZ01889.1 hypothetical protein CLAUR_018860 [Clostridium felsineum]URZ05275.1 hypothetical protein CLROS_005990 [Clostridium felsineum]URZ10316.1 hypothetical protein CROST_010240 [Clostridium felsineum]URZ17773.1 hypothetical protein CLFE_038280 [Clostridium felsineum DSM 794]
MYEIYTTYKCKVCKKEFVLLTEDIENMLKDRKLSCPYCLSKKILKRKPTSDLRECMEQRVYKRVKGALRQIK